VRYASLSDAVDTLTWTEYQVMMMLEATYPIGVVRDDLRTALICYVTAAAAGAKDITPASFFVHDLLREHQASPQHIAQKVLSIASLADRIDGIDALKHLAISQTNEKTNG
jgi:hypothetical protein